jgi:hypothetical protein
MKAIKNCLLGMAIHLSFLNLEVFMESIDIVNQVKDIFDPIAKKLGMSELPIVKHTYTELSFGYLASAIGIEVSIDLNYFFTHL